MAEPAVDLAVYLDTNVFIKAVEGTAEAADPARNLLQVLRRHGGIAVTGEITFAEVLAPPQRQDAPPPGVERRVYLDLQSRCGFFLSSDRHFGLVPAGMQRVDPDHDGLFDPIGKRS